MTKNNAKKMVSTETFIIAGLIIAFVIGSCAVFFASGNPDGLESASLFVQDTKELFGESPDEGDPEAIGTGTFEFEAPIPDYSLERGAGIDVIVAICGILLTFVVGFGAARLLARKN